MEPVPFDTKNQSHLINGPVTFDTWNQSH